MSSDGSAPQALVIPKERRPLWRSWLVPVSLVIAAGAVAWMAGTNPNRLWSKTAPKLAVLTIDKGPLELVVTENGTLESADNATVRCEVEALMGLTGGAQGKAQVGRGGNQQGGQMGAGGAAGGAAGGQGGGQAGAAAQPAPTAASKSKTAAKGATKAGGAKAKVVGAGVASASPTPAPGAGGAGAGGAGGAGGAAGDPAAGGTGVKRPDIRSFSYIVEPHIPLRGATAKPATQTTTKQQNQQMMMGGQGGGGRGGGGGGRGGGGGGNNQMQMELPGSTRIIEILPEGTHVKAGDIVVKLDSAAFRDELQAQRIRYITAKSFVEQAKSILEVNEISHREYTEGVFPQDQQLIRQYITTCRIQEDQAKRTLKWSRETAKKGMRANAQVKADELAYDQAAIALRDAIGMEERLVKYTNPRINKARLAKIEAVKADLASQEAALHNETVRMNRLQKMVENCTMRAPRDGIVAYANQSNRWGMVEAQIQEGVTVRQGQPIFHVPDPKRMRVKARVNESKTSLIESGQRVQIRLDAFPDRPLMGTVAEITAIPAPASAGNMDVQVYYATVNIDTGGFDELRPGLSAEVDFLIDRRQEVVRVPLQGVRWVNSKAYAAVAQTAPDGRTTWEWRQLKLGLTDAKRAEVLEGLRPGDRVLADPGSLPVTEIGRNTMAGSRLDRS